MSETLFPYYERELLYIRQFAQEFAQRYPATAGQLLLDPNRSNDPHIERMLESFALLAGRIHHKLDDEFPELTEALLSVLYPHYLAPIPSMAMVQFELDPTRARLPQGFRIERHSRVRTAPSADVACKYRTVYPVTLWPVAVTGARQLPPPFPPELRPPPGTEAALLLRLECQSGLRFADLSLETLRFYLNGDNSSMANLYGVLFNHTIQVQFRPLDVETRQRPLTLPSRQCLAQVGFELDEGMLPYPRHSFAGYRLLTEVFTFPAKFLFVDLGGFRPVCRAGAQRQLEIVFFLNRRLPVLEDAVTPSTFRLGCTPVVNLFEQICEPIALTQSRFEYQVVPEVSQPLGMEVYSIQAVTRVDPATAKSTECHPFFSLRHGVTEASRHAFWYATRRRSTRDEDNGTEVFLNLVDLAFNPRLPAEATLVVRALCTNRNVPAQLQRSGEQLVLVLEAPAPLAAVHCLRAPTVPLRPPLRRGLHWRLISHLTLNHLSLTDAADGCAALQEILRLYNFSDAESGAAVTELSSVAAQLIEGIVSVRSDRVVRQVGKSGAHSFCQGIEVTLELDEQKYVGTGVFLFASVLERFLGAYAAVNSFTQLVGKLKQQESPFKRWPPRAGEQYLL